MAGNTAVMGRPLVMSLLYFGFVNGFIQIRQNPIDPETGQPIPSQGQILIENANGTRGEICDAGWGIDEANVACRQAGYSLGAWAFTVDSAFGTTGRSGNRSMAAVDCTGSEASLLDCSYSAFGGGRCNLDWHWRERMAGVYCKASASEKPLIHLIKERSRTRTIYKGGLIAVNATGGAGYACHNRWTMKESHVACRQLGFVRAVDYAKASTVTYDYGSALVNVTCGSGSEASLLDCAADAATTNRECKANEAISITCLACRREWFPGRGSGGSYRSQSRRLNASECVFACNLEGANGVSRSDDGRYCYCHFGMTGSDGRSGFKAAFLDGCRSPSEIPPDALNPENGFTVSLRGGKDSSEGHLWVGNRRGQAGIVCDEGFGMKEATVACRQLGFSRARSFTRGSFFDPTDHSALHKSEINYLQCAGDEQRLQDCSYSVTTSKCRREIAGVVCTNDSESASDSLARVYNGPSAAEGDLAVTSSEGQLGFLCLPTPSGDPPRPDVNLVSVACRQMGFDAGLAVTPANFYTGGKGKFAHSFVPVSIECIGTETSLDRCRHTALSNTYSCYSGRREAGVICASQEPSEPFLRFWRNRASTSNEGFPFVGVQRVNEWVFGGICDEDGQFGMPEANLVCRQVGFAHGAVEPIKAPFITTTPVYGRTVVVANLKCNASATTLNDCAFKMSDTCGERDWVKLDCAESLGDTPSPTFNSTLELIPQDRPHMGTLRTRNRFGRTGFVSAYNWGYKEATVACRQIGYAAGAQGFTRTINMDFAQPSRSGSETRVMYNVRCRGDEARIQDCAHTSRSNSLSLGVAGVVCREENRTPDASFFLVGANDGHKGDLVFRTKEKQYTPMCDHYGWNLTKASYVCNQLGYTSGAQSFTLGSFFRENFLTRWKTSNLTCVSGDSCDAAEEADCDSFEGVGLVCKRSADEPAPDDVFLSGGSGPNEGNVMVRDPTTGWLSPVCSHGWDAVDAGVICRQLGFAEADSHTTGSAFGKGGRRFSMAKVQCAGNETRLDECPQDASYARNCDDYSLAGVRCRGNPDLLFYGGTASVKGRVPGTETTLDFLVDMSWKASSTEIGQCANASIALEPFTGCSINTCVGSDPCLASVTLEPSMKYMCLGESSRDRWTRAVRTIRCTVASAVVSSSAPLMVKFVSPSNEFALAAKASQISLPATKSPRILSLPVNRERVGCGAQEVNVFVQNEGNVRCRFPNVADPRDKHYCHGKYNCQPVNGLAIDEPTCKLTLQTDTVAAGLHFVTVIAEGLSSDNSTLLSASATNFQLYLISTGSCHYRPRLTSPADGDCVPFVPQTPIGIFLNARSSSGTIEEFPAILTHGLRVSIETQDEYREEVEQAGDVTFLRGSLEASGLGTTHPVCVSVIDSRYGHQAKLQCFTLVEAEVVPAVTAIEPTGVAMHPSRTKWTVKFNVPVKTASRGFVRLKSVRNGGGWKITTSGGIATQGSIYSSQVTVSDDGLSAEVSYNRGDRLTANEDYLFFGEIVGDLFVPKNPNPNCTVAGIKLSRFDAWTFKIKDYNPPRLTFRWPNRNNRIKGGNFTVTWYSSERPHFDRCELVSSLAEEPSPLNCSDARWISGSMDLSEGDYILRVTTADSQNNTAVWEGGFTIDKQAPSVNILKAPAKVANTEGANRHFALACTGSSDRCKLDIVVRNHRMELPTTTSWLSPSQTYAFDVATLGLESGKTYRLEAFATDEAGNVGSTVFYEWKVDRTTPQFTLSQSVAPVTCEADLNSVNEPTVTSVGPSGNHSISFSDAIEECKVVRTWTVTDGAGNSASKTQDLSMAVRDVQLKLLQTVTMSCDSSRQLGYVETSASVRHDCFKGHVPHDLAASDSIGPPPHPCPGRWSRTFTATSRCDGAAVMAVQSVATVDLCPASACGRSEQPPRGVCISGRCSCNRPWYGTNCHVKILEPKLQESAIVLDTEEGRDFKYAPSLLEGNKPLAWNLTSGPDRLKIDVVSGNLTLRRTDAGFYAIRAVVKNSVGEAHLSLNLTVRSTYRARLDAVVPDTYPRSRVIFLRGRVEFDSGSYIQSLLASVVPVSVRIARDGSHSQITMSTLTRRDGSFEVPFRTASTEYGTYRAWASHPFNTTAGESQAVWYVLGMRPTPRRVRLSGETVAAFSRVYENATQLVNDGPKTLTALRGDIPHAAELRREGIDIGILVDGRQQLDSLSAGQSAPITLSLNTTGPVPSGSVLALFKSGEGVEKRLVLELDVDLITPDLVVDPPRVRTRALRGGSKLLEFTVTNAGRVPATDLKVRMPENEILSVLSFGTNLLESRQNGTGLRLPRNATAGLTLKISPPAEHPLGEFSGRFLLKCAETSKSVSFNLLVSSDVTLDFTVAVEDEYTYFAEPDFPLVANATVRIVNHRRGVDLRLVTAEGNGTVTFRGLVEDRYELYVKAPDHLSVHRVVVLDVDARTPYRVFLEREAVKYTWEVRPKPIRDRYEFRVKADFKARVPMPVVTVTPNNIDLEPYKLGYEDTIVFNVTNHGLIKADALGLEMPMNHPFLEFDEFPELGDLEALSSVSVVVNVRRKQPQDRIIQAVHWIVYGAKVYYSVRIKQNPTDRF